MGHPLHATLLDIHYALHHGGLGEKGLPLDELRLWWQASTSTSWSIWTILGKKTPDLRGAVLLLHGSCVYTILPRVVKPCFPFIPSMSLSLFRRRETFSVDPVVSFSRLSLGVHAGYGGSDPVASDCIVIRPGCSPPGLAFSRRVVFISSR